MNHDAEALRAADAEARRIAQREFTRPLVLQAGAGTGKTATLVARVLAWTLGPGWERAEAALQRGDPGVHVPAQRIAARTLDRVVAITFTEAAAAEMAQRVDRALAELLVGTTPIGVELAALPEPPLRLARAAALRAVLDHLQVQTIHAWCRRLLGAHPLAARVHPTFQVDADGRRREAVARRVLTQRLRMAYTGREAGALRLAARGVGPAELEAALLTLLEQGVHAEALSADLVSPARLEALLQRLRTALNALCDAGTCAIGQLRSGVVGSLNAALAQSLAALPAEATLESMQLLAARFERLWDEENLIDRLTDWSRQKFNKGEQKAFGGACDEIRRASGELAPLLRHVLQLDLPLLEAARPLLAELVGEVRELLRRSGVLDFGDLLAGAAELLSEHSEVAAAVRGEIEQLLVDEFQDTDRRQCAIVGAIALDGDPHERPGLFLVGDPKQSIYGWREADLAAYEAFVSRVLAAGGTRHPLCVNHRSVRCVLDEVERVIEPVMQAEAGLQPAFEPLVPRLDAPIGEPVEYWLPARLDAAALAKTSASQAIALEAQALARHFEALHRTGVAWNQIALLSRSRSDWDVYLDALRGRSIPYSVEGDRHYYRRREIIEAAAWVRCVLDPNDVVALVAALRSSAAGVPDAAWIGLFAAALPARAAQLDGSGDDAERLADLARDAEAVAASLGDDVPGIERVRGWQHALVAALAAIGRLRRVFEEAEPDVFVETLRDALHFEASESARYLGAWRVANLERFFQDLSASLCEGGSPAEVLRALRRAVAEEEPSERAQPRDLEADGVRVMTLHGAKGLDFQHVFLIQLHKGSALRSDAVLEVGRVGEELELRLHGAPTPGFDRVVRLRERVMEAERVRLLYVGMTRAREGLVLSGLPPTWQSSRRFDTHAALLARRVPEPPDWSAVFDACIASGSAAREEGGARWRVLALEPVEPAPDAQRSGRESLDAARLRADAERLRGDSESAAARAAFPRSVPASQGDRDADAREFDAPDARTHAPSGTPAQRARLVGSVVHLVLERWDPASGAELATELEALLPEVLAGTAPLAAEDQQAVAESAHALLMRLARGALGAKLGALRHHIVARELPVLLAPGEARATGFVAGAIDLVYRDPESGELVVVDYKTDQVAEAQGLPAERRVAYARQGAVYQRALRDALALERTPRFELWLLAADRCEVI